MGRELLSRALDKKRDRAFSRLPEPEPPISLELLAPAQSNFAAAVTIDCQDSSPLRGASASGPQPPSPRLAGLVLRLGREYLLMPRARLFRLI